MGRIVFALYAVLGIVIIGCSSSGSAPTGNTTTQVTSDFNVAFAPSSWTVQSGSSLSVQVAVTWTGTIAGSISLNLTAPPTGISAVPVTISQGSTSGTLVLLAAASLSKGSSSLQFTATSSTGQTHNYTIPLTISGPAIPLPVAGRTSYILTGQIPESIVYDRAHKLLYAAIPALNQVLLIDATQHAVIKAISVGTPGGMDISPDGSQIVVGSDLVSSLTFISTSSQSVTKTVPLNPAQNGTNFFGLTLSGAVTTPVFLAGGDVLFLEGVNLFRWSSVTNTISVVTPNTGNIGFSYSRDLHRTPDGSKVLITTSQNFLFIYDSATNSITAQNKVFAAFAGSDPVNPRFAAFDSNGFEIFDTSLHQLGTLPFSNVGASRPYGLQFSLDGTQLFVAQSGLFGGLYAYRTIDAVHYTLGQQAPLMSFTGDDETSADVDSEFPLAIDENNLIYGQGLRGIAIDDPLNYYATTSPATGRGFEFFNPNTGPVGTANLTQPYNSYSPTPGVYFDGVPALGVSPGSNNNLSIMTPLIGTPGPVSINMVEPDRSFSFYPAAFTFGIKATNLQPSAGPATGGITADLLAYGVGGGLAGVSVTVGGAAAKVISVTRVGGLFPNPLPYYDVRFTVPPGTANTAVDVTLSGPSGSATLSKAFQYEPEIANYPFPSANIPDRIVYDPSRKQLYLGTRDHIDVFSTSSRSFLAPIVPPTLHGKLALNEFDISPDGKWLVVANLADESIAIINPDQPSTAKLAPLGFMSGGYTYGPYSVTANSKGTFFVGLGVVGISGGGNSLYELNPVSGTLQQRTSLGTAILQTAGYRLLRSKDGTKVLVASPDGSAGPILLWTASTDTFTSLTTPGFVWDAAISPDGTTLGVPVSPQGENLTYQYVLDSNFNVLANVIGPEGLHSGTLYGQFLSPSGALLYVPVINGIDINDIHKGTLVRRIAVNEPGNGTVYRAAIPDDTGSYIYLLTLNGLDVIQDIPPLSVRNMSPLPNAVSAGTVITVKGSNFQPGATATISGQNVSTIVTDPQTLTFVLPSIQSDINLKITNPNGETYSF